MNSILKLIDCDDLHPTSMVDSESIYSKFESGFASNTSVIKHFN